MTRPNPAKRRIPGPRKPRGLSRSELTVALGRSLASIDRMIAGGLTPLGDRGGRGREKVYSLTQARKMLAATARSVDPSAFQDLCSMADDVRSRNSAIRARFAPLAVVATAWPGVVNWFAAQTERWPARLAGICSTLAKDDGGRLDLPEAQPSQHPRMKLIRDRGVVGSARFVPDDGPVPAPKPSRSIGFVHPLLVALAEQLPSSGLVIRTAPPEPEPPTPTTLEEARSSWRRARTRYRQTRMALRPGAVPIAACRDAIDAAATRFRAKWLAFRHQAGRLLSEGKPEQIETAAIEWRREALDALAAFQPPTTNERM